MNLKIITLFSLLFVSFFISGCTSSQKKQTEYPTELIQEQTIQQRIFVLGDSLSAGYQLAYEDSYPAQLESLLRSNGYSVKVINGGESGDTSAGLKSRIDRITADAQTGDIALIVIGGNDGLQGLSTNDLKNNISEIITILQQRGLKTIIGGMQIPTNLGESYRSNFASVYPTVANDTNSILIPFILSGVAGIPELNLNDGIHPNSTGQAIIADTVFNIIKNNNLLIK